MFMFNNVNDTKPLSVLDRLAKLVAGYRSSSAERCVFRSISDAFYRENFHSDLLAYYFEEPLVKRKLIDWLNEIREQEDRLFFSEFEYGEVRRENLRIDILLLSNNGDEAILIENKSNEAVDQFRQLPHYVAELEKRGCKIKAILYLTHSAAKGPTTEGWTEGEKIVIKKQMCSAKLVGCDSLTEKLIDPVLQESTDIRLSGLSLELKKLFHTLVYGGLNMSTMADFAAELQAGKNYDNLRQIIRAYNDLPSFWRETYKQKIENILNQSKDAGTKVRIGRYQQTCVFVDRIYIEGKHIAIDTVFSHERVEFFFVGREGCSETDIDSIKDRFGAHWPFGNERDERSKRYSHVIENPFDEQAILGYLKRVFVAVGALQATSGGNDFREHGFGESSAV